jgi:hypothetical protein
VRAPYERPFNDFSQRDTRRIKPAGDDEDGGGGGGDDDDDDDDD